MVRLTTGRALALATQLGLVTAIETCPHAETTYTDASNGVPYAICTGTDYQGASSQQTGNVANTSACAQLCVDSLTCVKAVYDTEASICHIKDNSASPSWVVSARFDVIRLQNGWRQGTYLATCPFPTSTFSQGGQRYEICPDTDYVGPSLQVVNNVASNTACAQICQTTAGCTKAVWDSNGGSCHIKSPDEGAVWWATSKRYDTIRLVQAGPNPATMGRWSDLLRFPVIPVAGYIVPATPEPERMLVFSSWGVDRFGGPGGRTQYADFNFKTGAMTHREVANTRHDMFCPGLSTLADGRMVISGGANAEATSVYDAATNSFTRTGDMVIPRGYQSSTTLSDGRIFTIGGSYTGDLDQKKTGEVYDPASDTWTLLSACSVDPMLTADHEGAWRTDNHAWLYGWSNASVFQAGPSKAQNWYGTSGAGSTAPAGIRDSIDDAMCGTHVMYDAGKILSAGGAPDYDNSAAVARAHITTIGAANQPATVERVADMSSARAFANAVVLPDGTVLVTGGQRTAHVFTDTEANLTPELFSPASRTWRRLAPESIARNYHSISLLLPDGTVFSGGGGLCATSVDGPHNCAFAVDHPDGQIFSPPYLFNADGSAATRPVISALSATELRAGASLTLTVSGPADASLSLIRLGSVTHSTNTDQRRIALTSTQSASQYTVTLPRDYGLLLPGYYYLFAVSPAGVPSVAKTIHVVL